MLTQLSFRVSVRGTSITSWTIISGSTCADMFNDAVLMRGCAPAVYFLCMMRTC